MKKSALAVVTAMSMLAGCVAEEDSGTVSVTTVELAADGTYSVSEHIITLEEQQALAEARERDHALLGKPGVTRIEQAIYRDTGCSAASLWLYDQMYYTGNMLCLRGGGTALLSQFTHHCVGNFCQTWYHKPQSLWAGESPGNVKSHWPYPLTATDTYYFSAYLKIGKFHDDPGMNNVFQATLSF